MRDSEAIEHRLRLFAAGAGVATAGIGGIYLVAWLSGLMTYQGFQAITMKANPSLCLLLCGMALLPAVQQNPGPVTRSIARTAAAVALLLGGLTFLEHLGGWDFGIDQLIAQEPSGALGVEHPNRMGPPAAVCLSLGAVALMLLLRQQKPARIAQWIGLILCLTALLGILAYLYKVEWLYGAARFTAIAWPTAVAILLLGMGILSARPTEGLMAQITSPDPGGVAIRLLLPASVLIPITLGWLHLEGEWLGLYERYFGTTVLVLSWIVIFSFLIYKTGAWISDSADATKRSEERFRSFVEASAQVIWTTNKRGEVTMDIPAWQAYTGQSAEEARGFGWMDAIDEQDRSRVAEAWAKAFATKGIYEVEYRVRRHDGTWRDILARGVPVLDMEGNVREYMGTCADITERKRAEEALRRTVTELERSNRELQQFAYVSSHDLQEPLRTVASYVQLLRKRYQGKLDERADRYISYTVEAAQRMSALIRDLLAFSRIGIEERPFGRVDLEAVVSRTLESLAAPIRESGAEVSHDPLPAVEGDDVQLAQLFGNLLGNALTYRKKEVPPRVHISVEIRENHWIFGVHDNGIGLDPRFYDRIFRIFQRLHQREEYPGTGMGLAICRKIVERHSGRIWVESTPGEGASFYVSLPRIMEE